MCSLREYSLRNNVTVQVEGCADLRVSHQFGNNVRTHQTLCGETPVKSTPPPKTTAKDTVLSAKPILGGLYHDYDKAA
jgi:hypothetical protein